MKLNFYIKDLVFKCVYILVSLFITWCFVFINKDVFIFFSLSLVSISKPFFIVTAPTDVFYSDILLSFYVSFYTVFLFSLLFVGSFFFSSWYPHEFFRRVLLIGFFYCLNLFFSYLSFFVIIPNLWFFFSSFHTGASYLVYEYLPHYSLFISFILASHAFLFFAVFVIFVFILFFIQIIKRSFFFKFRKFCYIFFSILGGLLSPPDLLSQLLIFIMFSILFEIFLYFLCVSIKTIDSN